MSTNLDTEQNEGESKPSRAGAARLSLYLRCLEGWLRDGSEKVSSKQIAETLGLSDAQIRRDLTCLGNLGQPGVGYAIPNLIRAIRQALGLNRTWIAVLVGVGNLGRALLRYRGFHQQGFRIAALFDSDPTIVGKTFEGLTVHPLENLKEVVRTSNAELGLLTVPGEPAQAVAEQLAEAGIRGILNFAPTLLRLPKSVRLVNVDLTIQLEQLAYQVQLSSDN
jgi:redox-sensing transcriptional repressor